MLAAPGRPTELVAALFAVLTLYLACLVFGANDTVPALVLALVQGLLLLALTGTRWGRDALKGRRPLELPALAFGLAILVALWTLTPFIPGGAHPAWTYVGGGGASTLDTSATLIEIVKLLGLAAFFAVGWMLGRSDERARWTFNLIVVGGGLYALWALVRFASGHQAIDAGRLTADFLSANTAGTLFGVLTVLGLTAAFSAAHRRQHAPFKVRLAEALPWWAATLIFVACLFLSASRGGALATGLAVLAFFGLEALAGRLRLKAIGATVAAGALLLLIQGPLLISRLGEPGGQAGAERAALYATHWKAFLDSPLFGYGLGSFDQVNKMHLDMERFLPLWNVKAAHNVYLQWLEEAGLVGAIPMFAAIGLVLFGVARGMGRRRRSKTLLRGLIAANIVVLAHGWTDYALQVPAVAAFWALLLGLQLGLAHATTAHRT